VPVSFLWDGDEHEQVELELGETDGDFIVVKSGLLVGQQVSLLYPDNFSRQ
jgi:multidrug efflux pump subunit AcrA (membrane-fusion protein)